MATVLICDDDKLIRNGVAAFLTELGLCSVVEARNGTEGLALFRQFSPEVIVTDIHMPDLDGISMVRRIREEGAQTKIIILTGYAELDYLKAAFKNDVIDFLIKPVDPEEMGQAVKKALRKQADEENFKNHLLSLRHKVLTTLPSYRENYFTALVTDPAVDTTRLAKKMEFMELPFNVDDEYLAFCVRISDEKGFSSEMEAELFKLMVVNVMQELVDRKHRGYVFSLEKNKYAGVLSTGESTCPEDFSTLFSEIRTTLPEYLKCQCAVGVGPFVVGLQNTGESFMYAAQSLNRQFLHGYNTVFYSETLRQEEGTVKPPQGELIERLIRSLWQEDRKDAAGASEALFKEVRAGGPYDIKSIHSYFHLLFMELYDGFLKKLGLPVMELVSNFTEGLRMCENLLQLEAFFLARINQYIDFKNARSSGENQVVAQLKSIIHAEYDQDLTINALSRRVFLSVNYLCLLFKKEMNMTINDYLTRYRMEKARELLTEGKHKLSEIAGLVGYQDQKYFSKIFKKVTGMNPSELMK